MSIKGAITRTKTRKYLEKSQESDNKFGSITMSGKSIPHSVRSHS